MIQTQKYLNTLNDRRKTKQLRILWPDYQIIHLLDQDVSLTNLHSYCFFEKFNIIKSNTKDYLGLNELFDKEVTHVAFYTQIKQKFSLNDLENNSYNRRLKSIEKMYNRNLDANKIPQQFYIILSKRILAIDQIIKTSHKIMISIIPFSDKNNLWGGALSYEQLQDKKVNEGMFSNIKQSFGFNINSKPHQSMRKSNGFSCRQSQNLNATLSQKVQIIPKLQSLTKCSNILKITPQHIHQSNKLLYIEIDLVNNTQLNRHKQYQFRELVIYCRRFKPTYGQVYYDDASSDQEYNNKQFHKQEIYNVYHIKFQTFQSYLDSQINPKHQYPQLNFRASAKIFSNLRQSCLVSNKNHQKQTQYRSKTKYVQIKKPQQIDKKILQKQQYNEQNIVRRQIINKKKQNNYGIYQVNQQIKLNYQRSKQDKKEIVARQLEVKKHQLISILIAELTSPMPISHPIHISTLISNKIHYYPLPFQIILISQKIQTIIVKTETQQQINKHKVFVRDLIDRRGEIQIDMKGKPIQTGVKQCNVLLTNRTYKQSIVRNMVDFLKCKSYQQLNLWLIQTIQQQQVQDIKLFITLIDQLKIQSLKQLVLISLVETLNKINQNNIKQINNYVSCQIQIQKSKIIYNYNQSYEQRRQNALLWLYLNQNLLINQQIVLKCIQPLLKPTLFQFFLLNIKILLHKYQFEFNNIIHSTQNTKFIIKMIQFTLEFLQYVPLNFIVEIDEQSTENDNIYVDIVIDLIAIYNALNGIPNAIQLINKHNQTLIRQNYIHDMNFCLFNPSILEDEQVKLCQQKQFNYISLQNLQQTNKSQAQPNLQDLNHYQSFYTIQNSINNQNISIKSQCFSLSNRQNPFTEQIMKSKIDDSYKFILSLNQRNLQSQNSYSNRRDNYFTLLYVPKIQKIVWKQQRNYQTFKCFQVDIQISINNGKQLMKSKMFCCFQRNIVTSQTCDFLYSPQLISIKTLHISIFYKSHPIYQNSLLFLSLRLPKYLKKLPPLKQQFIQSSQNKRKSIGGRMTTYLNKRKSVNIIQKKLFIRKDQMIFDSQRKNNQHIFSLSYLFTMDQHTLFYILKADRNYVQDQHTLLRFIQLYYEHKPSKYQDQVLYLALRPKYIRTTQILQRHFINPKYNQSKILNTLRKIKTSNILQDLQELNPIFINKPRISSILPLKNINNTKQQNRLFGKYIQSNNKKNRSIEKQSLINMSRNKQPVKEIQI